MSNASRNSRAKLSSIPVVAYKIPKRIEKMTPPVTGSGMLYALKKKIFLFRYLPKIGLNNQLRWCHWGLLPWFI